MSAHSTLGIRVFSCWESTAGTRPTTGYTLVSDEITDIPAFDSAPQGIDVTPLSETVSVRRIPGLKDNGEDFAMTANLNDTDMTTWAGLVTTAATNIPLGKYLWLMIIIPGITKAYFVCGTPVALGLPALGVNEAVQGDLHLVPYKDGGWDTKATYTSA